jgi:hypothetical protein
MIALLALAPGRCDWSDAFGDGSVTATGDPDLVTQVAGWFRPASGRGLRKKTKDFPPTVRCQTLVVRRPSRRASGSAPSYHCPRTSPVAGLIDSTIVSALVHPRLISVRQYLSCETRMRMAGSGRA